jgi:hypothetical protein
MPSPRRVRMLFTAVLAGVIITLFYTSHLRHSHEKDSHALGDFYHKTVNAIDHKKPLGQTVLDTKTGKGVGHTPADKDADGDVDADDEQLSREMTERLKAAEQKAKDLANQKSPLKPDPPSEVIGVGSSRVGQEKKKKVGSASDSAPDEDEHKETEEEHKVELELNSILKKSPGESV